MKILLALLASASLLCLFPATAKTQEIYCQATHCAELKGFYVTRNSDGDVTVTVLKWGGGAQSFEVSAESSEEIASGLTRSTITLREGDTWGSVENCHEIPFTCE